MAEMNFSIIAINASLKQKSVFIECALDIDEDTVSSSSVILLNKTTNSVELCDFVVDGHIIQAKMKNDPQPGDTYTILVQGTIESVVGDKLESALFREFSFKSEVVSEVTLLSPANFERINKASFKWEEHGQALTNVYELQIAKENAFYNIVIQSTIADSTTFEAPELEAGQFYVRVRAIKGTEYGRWSEVSTFMFEKPAAVPSNPDPAPASDDSDVIVPPAKPEDPDAPVIIVDDAVLTLNELPTNGVTPSGSFSFVFSEDIDIDNAEIRMYRSDF